MVWNTRAMPAPVIRLAAFEPFGGRRRNAALEAARLVAARTDLDLVELPVRFDRLASATRSLLRDTPDVLLLLGESKRARRLNIERVALNLIDARIADNGGRQPKDAKVVRSGPAAYFCTVDVRAALAAAGRDAELSLSAGSFACNAALYHALHRAESTRVGFVHVPASSRDMPTLRVARALERIVRALGTGR